MWMGVSVLRNAPYISHITEGNILRIRFSQSDGKIWWKCSHTPFARVWDPSTCWLWNGVLKRCFFESVLNKSFTVCNFRNKVAITFITCFKMFKICSRFQKLNKKQEQVFCFWDNCIWIGDEKFSQSQTGYMPLGVNVLGNTPKV